MACFSIPFFAQLAVWAIIAWGIYAIVMLLLSKIQAGEPWTTVYQIFRIIAIVIVAIWIVYLCVELISCAFSAGPGFVNFGRVR